MRRPKWEGGILNVHNFQFCSQFNLNFMLKSFIKKIFPNPFSGEYHIGFVCKDCINKISDWYRNVVWIDTNGYEKEGWFADPFFYSVDDNEIVLLAEQLYYPINRGRLVKMTLDKQYKLLSVEPILTLDTHLSFPNVWRENNKIYVYPENYQGGALSIWEFDGYQMSNPKVLIPEPLIDSQIVKLNNEYFIFAVKYQSGEWSDTQHLQIWKSSNLFGPYEHIQTISSSKNYERGAGEIIVIDDKTIIRPAQNCEGGYGKEVILFKMTYDGIYFKEEELERISPSTKSKYGEVLHTYNVMGRVCVIDGFTHYHRLWYKFLKKTIYRDKQV